VTTVALLLFMMKKGWARLMLVANKHKSQREILRVAHTARHDTISYAVCCLNNTGNVGLNEGYRCHTIIIEDAATLPDSSELSNELELALLSECISRSSSDPSSSETVGLVSRWLLGSSSRRIKASD
jgi:hypothetical protein